MLSLPAAGTYRSFTDADLEHLGVECQTMMGFMTCVLVHVLKEHGLYPPQQRQEPSCLS